MPRGDKTGPAGQGPMTGRGMGYCGGYNTPGFMNPGFGRGGGRGLGRGFGWRRFWGYPYGAYPYQPQITKKEEKEMLEDEVADLEKELKEVRARLNQLEGQK